MTARAKRERVPPPFTDPATDPEFLALDNGRRTVILDRLDWVVEIDRATWKLDAAARIAERYEGTDTEGRSRTGLSAKNIYRVYNEWRKAGRAWQTLDKFRAPVAAQIRPVQRYNLTPESVHAFFKRKGTTATRWGAAHGFIPQAISRALHGTPGARSQAIWDMLAEEMRGEPQGWHQRIEALQAEAAELRARVADFDRRLADWKKRLPGWM